MSPGDKSAVTRLEPQNHNRGPTRAVDEWTRAKKQALGTGTLRVIVGSAVENSKRSIGHAFGVHYATPAPQPETAYVNLKFRMLLLSPFHLLWISCLPPKAIKVFASVLVSVPSAPPLALQMPAHHF